MVKTHPSTADVRATRTRRRSGWYAAMALCWLATTHGAAQTPPSASQIAQYTGLHQAAATGDTAQVVKLIAGKANLEERDSAGRTAVHVVAFASDEKILDVLAKAGADMNALENSAYDIVTIAAVANDIDMLNAALRNGASASNVTSPYNGTALIAAAHLGHYRIVERLIEAQAPLNHVNNLGWTALMESVVLGNGGANHLKTAKALVLAGADKSLGDRDGVTPLQHARRRGFANLARVLE